MAPPSGAVPWHTAGGLESAERFDLWHRDVLGVNMSQPLALTRVRRPGGFPDRNFHFGFEPHAEFSPDAARLTDDETHPIDFFLAERHRTRSSFRIETTLQPRSELLPTISVMCD